MPIKVKMRYYVTRPDEAHEGYTIDEEVVSVTLPVVANKYGIEIDSIYHIERLLMAQYKEHIEKKVEEAE